MFIGYLAPAVGALAKAGGGSAVAGAMNAVSTAGMVGGTVAGFQSNSVAKETTAATNKANLQAANIQKKTEEQRIQNEQKIAEQNNKTVLEKAKIDAKAQVDATKAANGGSSLLPSLGSTTPEGSTTPAGALATNLNMELGNSANNPNTAQQASQVGLSENPFRKTKSRQKLFGFGGAVKDLGKVIWGERGGMLGHVISGATMGAAGVGVGLALNAHMKSQGIDMEAMKKDVERQESLQKQMSEEVAEETLGKSLKKGIKGAPMGVAFGAVFEAPKVMSYMSNIDELKARYGKNVQGGPTQQNYSKTTLHFKRKTQKSFAFVPLKAGMAIKNNVVDRLISKPGETVLGWGSSLSMAGGQRGVGNFIDKVRAQGVKSGNETTVKMADWAKDHPKTMLAASIPIGTGVIMGAWEGGEKLTKKAAKKISPDYDVYERWSEMNG